MLIGILLDRKGKEGQGGRYAVFDVQYELETGEGTRNKISMLPFRLTQHWGSSPLIEI